MPPQLGPDARPPADHPAPTDAAGPVDSENRERPDRRGDAGADHEARTAAGGNAGAHRPATEESVRTLSRRLADYTQHIENLNIAEYVELVRNPFRMFLLNLLSGIGRGVGIAVGFTVLGAAVLLLLQRLVMLNLPGIGGFISEIVRIVQNDLSGP